MKISSIFQYIYKLTEIVGFKQRIHLDTIISIQMKSPLSYYLYLVSTRIDKYVYCIYIHILCRKRKFCIYLSTNTTITT